MCHEIGDDSSTGSRRGYIAWVIASQTPKETSSVSN